MSPNLNFLATLCEQGYVLNTNPDILEMYIPKYTASIYDRFGFRVCILESNTQVILVFIGSDDLMDWIANSAIRLVFPMFSKKCKIHRGFNVGTKLLYRKYKHKINSWRHKEVICTGHSLGGALATLASTALYKLDGLKSSVVSIAAPHIGDSNYVNLLWSCPIEVYKVTHPLDLVPTLPPTFLGYRSIGRGILYIPLEDLIDPPNQGNLFSYIHGWLAFKLIRTKFKMWSKYHDIGNYQKELYDYCIRTTKDS